MIERFKALVKDGASPVVPKALSSERATDDGASSWCLASSTAKTPPWAAGRKHNVVAREAVSSVVNDGEATQ